MDVPHNASFAYETIPPERDDHRMTGTCPPQVSANDCAAGNNSLAAEDDILGTGNGRASRDFVPSVLRANELNGIQDRHRTDPPSQCTPRACNRWARPCINETWCEEGPPAVVVVELKS